MLQSGTTTRIGGLVDPQVRVARHPLDRSSTQPEVTSAPANTPHRRVQRRPAEPISPKAPGGAATGDERQLDHPTAAARAEQCYRPRRLVSVCHDVELASAERARNIGHGLDAVITEKPSTHGAKRSEQTIQHSDRSGRFSSGFMSPRPRSRPATRQIVSSGP